MRIKELNAATGALIFSASNWATSDGVMLRQLICCQPFAAPV